MIATSYLGVASRRAEHYGKHAIHGLLGPKGGAGCGGEPLWLSSFQKILHLHPRKLDDVVIIEGVGLRVQTLAIENRKVRALDVGDVVTLRTASDHGHLHSRFAYGRQRL